MTPTESLRVYLRYRADSDPRVIAILVEIDEVCKYLGSFQEVKRLRSSHIDSLTVQYEHVIVNAVFYRHNDQLRVQVSGKGERYERSLFKLSEMCEIADQIALSWKSDDD